MIYVFSGDDRGKIQAEVKRILGDDYEVYEGQELGAGELMDIFFGTTIFAPVDGRKILIKDLTTTQGGEFDAYEEMGKYVENGFNAESRTIVIWESRKPTKGTFRKFVKMAGAEEKAFKKGRDFSEVTIFDVYRTALRDGEKAVRMVEGGSGGASGRGVSSGSARLGGGVACVNGGIEEKSDPYMSLGAMVSVAIKNYEYRYGEKEKRILKELAKLDIEMKTSEVDGWSLLKGFLVRVSEI